MATKKSQTEELEQAAEQAVEEISAPVSQTPLNVEVFGEEVPLGHTARIIVLSDEQWAAVDRQATRNRSTASEWLRRFLLPYLRRG